MNRQPQSARTRIRRIAAGRLISMTGGAAAYTALNFTIWHRTHSPGLQALTLLLTFGVAGILGPFTGVLGDRYDRRMVMLWSEAVSAAFFLAMAFAQSPGWLIALAFGSAIAEQPFLSASRAAIPNLVETEEQVTWANSLTTTGFHAGIAVGPVIGGVLLALVGASAVFAINAASFLVSMLLTLSVVGRFQADRDAAEHDEHRGLTAGIAFLWREPVLRRLSIAWLVFVLGMGMGMVADAALAESFSVGPVGFALLIACWGTGSVIGSATGRWMNPRTESVWLVAGAFGVSVAAFGVGFAPLYPLVLVSLLVMGTCDGLTIVSENSIMQRRTPDAVRSRAMAAFEAVLSFGLVVAFLTAGPVLNAIGPQSVYRIGGLSAGLAALTLLPMLRLRHTSSPDPDRQGDTAAPARYTSAESLDMVTIGAGTDGHHASSRRAP
jgi:MFS family permease